MRVLYLGMRGPFSRIPIETLLKAGINVCGIIVPASDDGGTTSIRVMEPSTPVSQLPLATWYAERSIVQIGWENQIPVYEVGDIKAVDTLATIVSLKPDLAIVACFPKLLSASVLNVPAHGFLNLHPSLLPAYRGPSPIFWIFRHGEQSAGVTVHFMDEGVDTGDILLQDSIAFPDGISGVEAEKLCAERGSELLIMALDRLGKGRLPRIPQGVGGSYYPWPSAADFRLPTSWSARRAFNFIRGTAEWGRPYVVAMDSGEVMIRRAVSFDPFGYIGSDMQNADGHVQIQFNPGWLMTTV